MTQGRYLKVLLLEDNPDHAELIVKSLSSRDEHFQVDHVVRPEDFIASGRDKNFDALIIDLQNSDGTVVLHDIKPDEIAAPIIFVSSSDNDDLITQVMNMGASDFIIKSRSSLKLLPIIIKRNIIRRMAQQEKLTSTDSLATQLTTHFEQSLKKVSNTALKITTQLGILQSSPLDSDKMRSLEELLERTSKSLQRARDRFKFQRYRNRILSAKNGGQLPSEDDDYSQPPTGEN